MLNTIKNALLNHHVVAICCIIYATIIGPYLLISKSPLLSSAGLIMTVLIGAYAYVATRVFLKKQDEQNRYRK